MTHRHDLYVLDLTRDAKSAAKEETRLQAQIQEWYAVANGVWRILVVLIAISLPAMITLGLVRAL
ncbi:hypothetical protein HT136_01535 [Novosphingobium profundi]|uniref:hypothetical protein n=1 Tax=Novosphingobium profundi TaxID=1774954 RepID=UPI001BDB41B6|nr:hypothetical protein [Novosphingobium profundi]MBT0667049.1 hypothetical protein [Novosphingobium profundi]